MSEEKLVPVDEELYNELVECYEDLDKELERDVVLEFGSDGSFDPTIIEKAMLTIDKILTAYDYYAENEKDGV